MNLYSEIEKLRKKLNLKYIEAEDKTKLYYREFLANIPEKILLCIHGLGGHSGDFIELGEKLKENNVSVFALDLRGHGLSQKENENYFSFQDILSDINLMINFLKGKYPSLPLYLLGESMGGIAILNIALENKDIQGLILVSAGIKPNIKLSVLDIMKILPLIPINLIFKNWKPINLEANWDKSNNNPERIKQMKEDVLLLRRVSLAFLLSIAKYHKRIMSDCINLQIPILILHGTGDEIVSYEGAEEFYQKLKSQNKQIKLFEGASHGLFADEKTPDVIKAIEEWM